MGMHVHTCTLTHIHTELTFFADRGETVATLVALADPTTVST